MKIVCAWCKKDMGEKPPLDNTDIIHGMCKACCQLELRKQRRLEKVRGRIT